MLPGHRESARLQSVNRQQWTRWLAVTALLAVFAGLAINTTRRSSATWDEPAYVTAGYFALSLHDYRATIDHPPFLRVWSALPYVFMSGIHADPSVISRSTMAEWMRAGQFTYPYRFLYMDNDPNRMLLPARIMMILLGVLLGGLLFAWVREWMGFWPAAITLAFYCLEPNLQAHASLVTTDFGVTCFMFGTMYFLWRTCRNRNIGNTVGLSLFFALAMVSKFSAVLLGPIVVILLAFHVWPKRQLKPISAVGIVALLFVVSWVAIWAAYGFRHAPSNDKSWAFHYDRDPEVQALAPTLARVVGWVDEHRLLPNACSQGFLHNYKQVQSRIAFLDGQYSNIGWWYYFPVAFLIKTPVALLLLVLAGAGLCMWRWRSFMADAAFIVLPVAIYFVVAMAQRINIGVRHILPIYPFLLMLAAVAIAEIVNRRSRTARAILAALALLWLGEFARAYPHNLSFFNSFVGGPKNGYKYLVDSNLDWGQDAPGLRRWLDKHNLNSRIAPVYLSYFGTADLAYHGIHIRRLPGNPDFDAPQELFPLSGGAYCISATMLQQVYSPFPGPWAAPYEQLYRQVFSNLNILERSDPQARQRLLDEKGAPFWNNQGAMFLQLRFARLCAYLRQREPDDNVGYSILIYRLSDA
jgi:4-amino-4-deoxy-L-arabinose transferase-like glycosyltransferase